jgi:chemotaxis response regulator CheB
MRTALVRMISCEPDMDVVATASCASVACEKTPTLDPDVVALHVNMPGLDGLGTLGCIMNQFPRPVIMVSPATEKDAETTLEALSAGAFDYVPKQMSQTSLEIAHVRNELISKIRAAAQSRRNRFSRVGAGKPPQAARFELGKSDSKPAIGLDKYPEDAIPVPSVDVLMNSVAQVFKNHALGGIMTGMGWDGAAGMTAIFRQGGLTFGQDEASCAVYGMPRVCARLGVLTHVLSLPDIPAYIIRATHRRRSASCNPSHNSGHQ